MNYIKLFENFDLLSSDIKDILWEISYDNKIDINVRKISTGPNKLIVTLSNSKSHGIDVNKYKDDFLRLREYTIINGYQFSSISYDKGGETIYPKILYKLKEKELFNYLFEIPITNYIRLYFK